MSEDTKDFGCWCAWCGKMFYVPWERIKMLEHNEVQNGWEIKVYCTHCVRVNYLRDIGK